MKTIQVVTLCIGCLMPAAAFSADLASLAGKWETSGQNCESDDPTGYGLNLGPDALSYVNYDTEGGQCTVLRTAMESSGALKVTAACSAEEGPVQTDEQLSLQYNGTTLTVSGAGWLDGPTTFHKCSGVLDLMGN